MNGKLKPVIAAMASTAAFGLGVAHAGETSTQPGSQSQRSASQSQQGVPVMAIVVIDQPNFVRLDANGDGRLSKDEIEVAQKLDQHFGDVDRDGNGYITWSEVNAFHQRLAMEHNQPIASARAAGSDAKASSADQSQSVQGPPSGATSYTTPEGHAQSGSHVQSGASDAGRAGSKDRDATKSATGAPQGPTSYDTSQSKANDRGTVGLDQSSQSADDRSKQPAAVIVVVDEPQFLRLDADRDNRLSRDEVRTVGRFNEVWDSVDRDKDGYLTREEVRDYNRLLSSDQSTNANQQGASAPRAVQGAPSGSNTYDVKPSNASAPREGSSQNSSQQSSDSGQSGSQPRGVQGPPSGSNTYGVKPEAGEKK